MRKLSTLLFGFLVATIFIAGNISQAAPPAWQRAAHSSRPPRPTPEPTDTKVPTPNPPTPTSAPNPPTPTSTPNPNATMVWGSNNKANTDVETCNPGYTNCAQHEPEVAANPHNDMNAVAAFKDWRDGKKQVYLATTFDGGQTWANQLPPGVRDLQVANESDPAVIFGADGVAYASLLCYNGPDEGPYITKSSDGGVNWSKVVPIWRGGRGSSDKEWIAIDTNPASPYYNRLYATWTNVDVGHFFAAYSSDGGASWSVPAQLNKGSTLVSIPAVLPNGNVLAVMYAEGTSEITTVKSTDGGASWSAERHAVDVGLSACEVTCTRRGTPQNWRIYTMPAVAVDAHNGNVYMVWLDGRNEASNGWDIYYSHSTDGGDSWSSPQRLNDDPPGRFIDQVLPTIAVATDGTVHVAWMDKRDDPNNVQMNLYYTYSTDGGVTFQPDSRLSSASSDYNIGIPIDSNHAASDYIGISAVGAVVWITWMDTRSNQQDVYTIRGVRNGAPAPPTPVTTPVAAPAQQANTDNPYTFSQTGKTIGGKFRTYWEQHGGLAQQGYPISNEFQEVSDLDGKTYTVQYFERAVFELHPENAGTAYEVELSQLGSFRYKQKYPNEATNQQASTDNPYKFDITGKSIGGKFRTYWEQHGGLAQQGYPISDQFQEVSDLDGKTYTVQYFERAVMELHPENAGTPYEVELSQLGRYQYKQKYPAAPQ